MFWLLRNGTIFGTMAPSKQTENPASLKRHKLNICIRLRGHFSRIDYIHAAQRRDVSTVVKSLEFEFPPEATDVYYRDEIGNVSTSNFRNEKSRSLLEIQPRYPMYGGWNYTWYHGYNVPLSSYVRYFPDQGKYAFQAKFVHSVSNSPVDRSVVKIVLPEGAS
jgi:oligosaccharyltransferase complex subunit alpha (ribophorin I)